MLGQSGPVEKWKEKYVCFDIGIQESYTRLLRANELVTINADLRMEFPCLLSCTRRMP